MNTDIKPGWMAVSVVLVLGAVAGCSSSGGSVDSQSPAAPVSASPSTSASLSTIEAVAPPFLTVGKMAEYLGERGFPCPGTPKLKATYMACTSAYMLFLYSSPEAALAKAESWSESDKGAGLETCLVVVGNGVISSEDQCDEIAVALQPEGAVKVTS